MSSATLRIEPTASASIKGANDRAYAINLNHLGQRKAKTSQSKARSAVQGHGQQYRGVGMLIEQLTLYWR